jgi:hypothetical protein
MKLTPHTYAYRYPDGIRYGTGDRAINGSKPIEAIPLYWGPDVEAELAAARELGPWKCKANPTADPPQDCDFPFCGCDPNAINVIETLQESGWIGPKEACDREKAAIAAARLEAAELIHIAILKNGNMYTHDILAALWKDVLERGASTSTEKSQGAPGSLREGEGRTEG